MEREGPEALAHSFSFYSSHITHLHITLLRSSHLARAAVVMAFSVCDSGITDGKGVLGQFVCALDGAEVVLFCTIFPSPA